MEVSGQFHCPAPLPPGKELSYPLGRRKRLGKSQSRPGRWEVENHLFLCQESNPGRPAGNPTVCVMSNLGSEIHELRDIEAAKKKKTKRASTMIEATHLLRYCVLSSDIFVRRHLGERKVKVTATGKSQLTGLWLSQASSRWGVQELTTSLSALVPRVCVCIATAAGASYDWWVRRDLAHTDLKVTAHLFHQAFVTPSDLSVCALYPSEITERNCTKCSIGSHKLKVVRNSQFRFMSFCWKLELPSW
jgi:hypothetical protein